MVPLFKIVVGPITFMFDVCSFTAKKRVLEFDYTFEGPFDVKKIMFESI